MGAAKNFKIDENDENFLILYNFFYLYFYYDSTHEICKRSNFIMISWWIAMLKVWPTKKLSTKWFICNNIVIMTEKILSNHYLTMLDKVNLALRKKKYYRSCCSAWEYQYWNGWKITNIWHKIRLQQIICVDPFYVHTLKLVIFFQWQVYQILKMKSLLIKFPKFLLSLHEFHWLSLYALAFIYL